MHFAVADKDNEAGGSSLEEVFVMGQSLAERHLWGHLDKILVTILKIHHDGGWSVPEVENKISLKYRVTSFGLRKKLKELQCLSSHF